MKQQFTVLLASKTVNWGGSLGTHTPHKEASSKATKVATSDASHTKRVHVHTSDPQGSGRCTELWPNTPTPERGGVIKKSLQKQGENSGFCEHHKSGANCKTQELMSQVRPPTRNGCEGYDLTQTIYHTPKKGSAHSISYKRDARKGHGISTTKVVEK